MNIWELFSTILIFSLGLVAGFFVTFLKEKGKNLAIQQDIGKITEEIDKVKLQNNLLLEEVKVDISYVWRPLIGGFKLIRKHTCFGEI